MNSKHAEDRRMSIHRQTLALEAHLALCLFQNLSDLGVSENRGP